MTRADGIAATAEQPDDRDRRVQRGQVRRDDDVDAGICLISRKKVLGYGYRLNGHWSRNR